MKVILDTSFLIELKKGNEKAVKALEKIKDKCEDILVSSLTVYELLVGANYVWRKYGDAREMMNLQDMLKFLTEVDVSGEVVRRAAKMKAELMVRGKDVPDIDILIACSDDAEILTFDSDFKPLRDLDFKITILGDEDG